MDESFNEHPRPVQSIRERELEVDVARLQAELEAARGGDAVEATSRFLTMASKTVDLAMEDARREADDLAAEVSADAEARRDEATRLAAEAEARAVVLRHEAENHEAVLFAAEEAALRIKADAEVEASNLVAVERTKVAEEIEALSSVRGALEDERGALENYHEELRRRVQELAESMVSFMTTEPPIAGASLDGFIAPPLPAAPVSPLTTPEMDPLADAMTVWVAERDPSTIDEVANVEPVESGDPVDFEQVVEFDTQPEYEAEDEAFVEHVAFAGVPVVEEDGAGTIPAGLFGRATEEEIEPRRQGGSLFGTHGARLVEQTSPEALAEALKEEGEEDERFRSFIAGDDETDASRDWLLRPEQS